jgi:hypothetical protein
MNDSTKPWVAIAVIVVVAVIATLLTHWSRKRGLKTVTRWADEQGFTIVELSRPFFVPFWRTGMYKPKRSQPQYFRVSLRGKEGNVRQAWICYYGFGQTHDPDSVVEVIWDKE